MITDVFIKRYKDVLPLPYEHWESQDRVPRQIAAFFRQADGILFEDLSKLSDEIFEDICRNAYLRLEREIGTELTRWDAQRRDYEDLCRVCLHERFDASMDADVFVKLRLSLIELLLRTYGKQWKQVAGHDDLIGHLTDFASTPAKSTAAETPDAFTKATQELNHRLREAKIPFHYHNGFLQRAEDETTTAQIDEPFWALVKDLKWKNVDMDIKEAIDRRDGGKADVAFYALSALESTIKIISKDNHWTRGKETGPAGFVDNLVSQRNGRFIDVWEADLLKKLFGHLRSPEAHGSGPDPPPSLTPEQQTWVIGTAMTWITSLIHRT